jgi:UDP:flavonoid glycosyltransferase YjiC (YdhE family)
MEKSKFKKIFIAPLNWGLGHATRDLPLIKAFLARGDKVYIAAAGRSLKLLQTEASKCIFVDFPDYPIRYPKTGFFVTKFMLVNFPKMLFAMWKEQRALKKLHKEYNFDFIVSDNRFCLYIPRVKCYLISHQLRYILPWPIGKLEWLPEYFNYLFFKNYDKIIIPDARDASVLTGNLSHKMRFIPKHKLYYAGILTDIVGKDPRQVADLDYFIIVSGPEPQRTKFEQIIFKEVKKLKGNVVVALGKAEANYKIRQANVIFYAFLNREEISSYLQRAKFIIGRSGYTSIMEMVELEKRGMFVPTPGQIEQEYLGKFYLQNGWCYCIGQHEFNLDKALKEAEKYPGFPKEYTKTDTNVSRLLKDLFS